MLGQIKVEQDNFLYFFVYCLNLKSANFTFFKKLDIDFPGFSGFMKAFYMKPPEFSTFICGMSFRELYEMLYLPKKYLVSAVSFEKV